MLLGYAYLFCMNVSSQPLSGSYGIPGIFVYLVGIFMLLNINLYCGNILWINLGDFFAISLVSYMVSMVGLVWLTKEYRHGNDVFSDAIF